MKTAVIYARYSCDNQTEQSIEGQLHVCEDFAKRNNIVIVDTYIDRAMTGTNDNRPAFQKMLSDSNMKCWNYVIVYKLDRFSRNKYETTIHKKRLKDNGVKVLSAMENIPDTPEGIILESLLEGMNQYYSAELSQKVLRGMKETRRKGFFQGGKVRYGYKLDGRKLVIDEDRAKIVNYIFTQYSLGVFVKDIINNLTAKGILYKGKPFCDKTVYGMLRTERYVGSYTIHGEVVENIYPQIISKELFDKVKSKLRKNQYGRRSIETHYLLRNKMKCGYCGNSIIAESGTSQNGQINYYYKCHGRKNLRNNCKKSTEPQHILEDVIVKGLIEEMSKPETISTITKLILQHQEKASGNNLFLSNLQKEQRQIETSINNILAAIEKGIVSTSTAKRLQDLEARQLEIEQLIIIERSKANMKLSKDAIIEFYKKGLSLSPLPLINYFVDEITLFDDEAIIKLKTPNDRSPDENQGFLISIKLLPKTNKNHNIVNFKLKLTL